jgi:putative transcriptional regulator
MPQHHPDDHLLIEYANGSLCEAKALLVATHLALCPACRAAVKAGEATSAALAFTEETVEVGPAPDVVSMPEEKRATVAPPISSTAVPEPLRTYLGAPVSELEWVPVWRGMKAFALSEFGGRASVRLLAIEPGRRMPRHTHEGEELTLVLQGSFADSSGSYGKGDVATADASVDHQPRAGGGELCLCLAVEDAPLRLTGFNGMAIGAVAAARRLIGR